MTTKKTGFSPASTAPPMAIKIKITMARREKTMFIICYLFTAVIILRLPR